MPKAADHHRHVEKMSKSVYLCNFGEITFIIRLQKFIANVVLIYAQLFSFLVLLCCIPKPKKVFT